MAAIINKYNLNWLWLLVALLPACQAKTEEAEDEAAEPCANEVVVPEAQLPAMNLKFAQAKPMVFYTVADARGRVDVPPQQVAKVSTQLPGYVSNLNLYVGMQVRKGQLLCQLSHPDITRLRQSYAKAVAQAEAAKKDLERQQALVAAEYGASKLVEAARATFEAAQAEVNSLAQQMQAAGVGKGPTGSTITISAPISGTLVAVNTAVGQLANPGAPLFEIINKEHLHLELQVFERDARQVRNRQLILYDVPAAHIKNARAHIVVASGTLQAEARQLQIHGHLDNEDLPLLPGMFVQARIVLDSAQHLAVPAAALAEEDGHYFLFAKTDKSRQFAMLPVEVIARQDELVAVKFLNEEDKEAEIAVENAYLLQNTRRAGTGEGCCD